MVKALDQIGFWYGCSEKLTLDYNPSLDKRDEYRTAAWDTGQTHACRISHAIFARSFYFCLELKRECFRRFIRNYLVDRGWTLWVRFLIQISRLCSYTLKTRDQPECRLNLLSFHRLHVLLPWTWDDQFYKRFDFWIQF